eukprot:g13438.t1
MVAVGLQVPDHLSVDIHNKAFQVFCLFARLLVLLQDIGATPHASDLDESGKRFMKAFEVHVAVRRWQLRTPNSETFLQYLSSEDGWTCAGPCIQIAKGPLWTTFWRHLGQILTGQPCGIVGWDSGFMTGQPSERCWSSSLESYCDARARRSNPSSDTVQLRLAEFLKVHGQTICNCHVPPQNHNKVVTKVEEKLPEKADIAPAVEELLRTAVAATAEAPNRAVKRRVRQRLHKKLGAVLNKEEFDRAMERFHDAVEAQRLQQEENLRCTPARQLGGPACGQSSGGRKAFASLCGGSCGHGTRNWAAWKVSADANADATRFAAGLERPSGLCCAGALQRWDVPLARRVSSERFGCETFRLQDVKQVQEHVRVPQMPMKTGLVPPQKAFNFCAAQAPNGFYAPPQEDSDGESIGQGVTFQRARSEGDCGTGSEMPGENLPVERTFIQFSTHGDSCKRSRSQ